MPIDYRIPGMIQPVRERVVTPLDLIKLQGAQQGIRANELAMQRTQQQIANEPLQMQMEQQKQQLAQQKYLADMLYKEDEARRKRAGERRAQTLFEQQQDPARLAQERRLRQANLERAEYERDVSRQQAEDPFYGKYSKGAFAARLARNPNDKEAQAGLDVLSEQELRVAEGRGLNAAQIQANAVAEKTKAELNARPIPTAAADKLGMTNALVDFTNQLGTLFKSKYTGPVQGLLGGVRQFSGNIDDDEIEFRRLSQSIKNYIMNLLSGAAISPQEAVRLERQVPNVYRQPNVYSRQLEGFADELIRIRDRKLQLYVTPRDQINQMMPKRNFNLSGDQITVNTPVGGGVDNDPLGVR